MTDKAVNGRVPDWLKEYVDRGFKLVFYATKTKGPKGKSDAAWQLKDYTPEDYHEGQNVGVVTGAEIEPGKYLVDVDFDWADGVILSKRLLPPTEFGFGRASRKVSHAFYTSPVPLALKNYDNVDGKRIVELRGTKTDGSLGLQTMVPPSVHPSEEVVTLRANGEIAHVENLERHVTLYAIGCLLLLNLHERGLLHDVRLALSGFLLQVGLTEEEVIRIGEAVANATGNNENDVELTVKTTAQRLARGERVYGSGALAKAIGDQGKKVIARIREWVGSGDFIRDDKDKTLPNKEENIILAFQRLDVKLRYDLFAEKTMVEYGRFKGVIDDAARNRIWLDLDKFFKFRPSQDVFDIVLADYARANEYHPVRAYLDSLNWDGVPRVDNWLTRYAGAAESDYVRGVAPIVLLGAVRRVRSPGAKLDEILVLESEQGLGKSTLVRALCPDDDWFSDDFPLDADSKQVIEATAGKWIIEAAELAGIAKSQAESVKRLISAQADGPVRMAYARLPIERPRQFVIFGTTNNHEYLSDSTGNRRYWPVRVSKCDVEGLKKDRDQIWAEAAAREARGESIRLDPSLYGVARVQQERRRHADPWERLIDNHFKEEKNYKILPEYIWEEVLHIPIERRDERGQRRISTILQQLGFVKRAIRHEGRVVKGWARDSYDKGGQLMNRGEDDV